MQWHCIPDVPETVFNQIVKFLECSSGSSFDILCLFTELYNHLHLHVCTAVLKQKIL